MDPSLPRLADAWGSITLGLFVLAVIGFVVALVLHATRRVRARQAGGIIGALLAALFVVGVIPTVQLRGCVRHASYAEFMARAPRADLPPGAHAAWVGFRCDGADSARRVDDPAQVARFFELIDRAPRVAAHHSHPLRPLRFAVDGLAGEHCLAPDSDVAGEFWLRLASGGEQAWPFRFRSPELAAWLQAHAPDCTRAR